MPPPSIVGEKANLKVILSSRFVSSAAPSPSPATRAVPSINNYPILPHTRAPGDSATFSSAPFPLTTFSAPVLGGPLHSPTSITTTASTPGVLSFPSQAGQGTTASRNSAMQGTPTTGMQNIVTQTATVTVTVPSPTITSPTHKGADDTSMSAVDTPPTPTYRYNLLPDPTQVPLLWNPASQEMLATDSASMVPPQTQEKNSPTTTMARSATGISPTKTTTGPADPKMVARATDLLKCVLCFLL
jgi:hypothetical protein